LKFNKGRIYITNNGGAELQLAVYKLTGQATFDDYTTYNNTTKVIESNNVTISNSSGAKGDGTGFVEFTFSTTTLTTTDHYYVGLFNNITGDAPQFLGYKDAGDPGRSLDNLFYLGNDGEATPGSNMQNTQDAGTKGDAPYICLYFT